MKLYQYDDIKKLNQALGSFAKNGVPVAKVKLLTVGEKIQYFILADPKEVYQKPVESKTEEKTLKTLKVKKEKKEEKVEPVAPSKNAGTVIEESVEKKEPEVVEKK